MLVILVFARCSDLLARWDTFSTFMLPCIVIDFFLNNQPDALIIQIYSLMKLYMPETCTVL